MGNAQPVQREASTTEDIWWTNGQQIDNIAPLDNKVILKEESSKCFDLDIAKIRERRREIIDAKRKEMNDLREEVDRLQKENEELRKYSNKVIVNDESASSSNDEFNKLLAENELLKSELKQKSELLEKSDILSEKNRELRISVAEMQEELQRLNSEVVNFEKERHDYQTHVTALKDVIKVSKQMLLIRENQSKELKEKVNAIEQTLAEREMNILSEDLRKEYERQLENIRRLKSLYEERQQADRRQKRELESTLDETKKELEREQKKTNDLEERIKELEEENSKKYDEIKSLDSNLGLSKAECRQYQAELTVINQLFSEILLGFQNSQDIDLDELTKHLEDHHDLLKNIVVNEISSEVSSALPKMLLDLVNQVNDKKKEEEDIKVVEDVEKKMMDVGKVPGKLETIIEESESQTSTFQQMNSAEEIAELLPKVWKVLIELLSHQKAPMNELSPENGSSNSCYKTVETSKGPNVVVSVSQTFIRLKKLILEKKSLQKEVSHLKHLNGHLENRMQDQEKRLEMVSSELSKTWHVVGKFQKQHQLLHTQEKILRYELAQKRKLLNTLKEELEYSREKWQQAREKNTSTEEQWRQLRSEFSSRRNVTTNDDFNNSVESGYSDERSSDDEPGYETDISEIKTDELSVVRNDEPVLSTETLCAENDVEGATIMESNEKTDVEVPLEIVEVPSEIVEVPSEIVEVPSEIVEVPSEIVKAPSEIVDSPSEIVEVPSEDVEARVSSEEKRVRTLEEVLAARDERFKRLEGQAEKLVRQVTETNVRSVEIANKLDSLHEAYGESSTSESKSEEDAK